MTSKEEAGLESLHGDSGTGRRTLDCTANQSIASLGTWRQSVFEVSSHTSTTSTTRIANAGTSEVGTGKCQTQLGDLRSKNSLIRPCCFMLLSTSDISYS